MPEPPTKDQITEALNALETHINDSKEPDARQRSSDIFGMYHWLKGDVAGREVGDYIASIIAREDQLNAGARDRAVDQGESDGPCET